MSLTITVPQEYSYVVLATTGSLFLSMWHALRIGKFRKAAGVPYPYPFAFPNTLDFKLATDDPKAKERYLFNCAQRAHANYLENLPLFIGSILIAGTKYPVAAAAAGGLWLAGRVIYAVGYTKKDATRGEGRILGSALGFVSIFGLLGMAAKVSIDLVRA